MKGGVKLGERHAGRSWGLVEVETERDLLQREAQRCEICYEILSCF